MKSSDPTQESRPGRTPAGGVRSTVYYLDASGRPAPKSRAARGEAVEFDASGEAIQRTYFDLPGSRPR